MEDRIIADDATVMPGCRRRRLRQADEAGSRSRGSPITDVSKRRAPAAAAPRH